MSAMRVLLAAATLLLSACGAPTDSGRAPAAESSAPDAVSPEAASPETIAAAEEEATAPTAGPASQADGAQILRPANFYRLDWEDNASLCAAALASLNQPFAPSPSADSDGAGDYASIQARDALGSADNLRWTLDAGDSEAAPSAIIDYFNDGVSHHVVRLFGKLSGSSIIGLGVKDAAGVSMLSFGHAGLASPAMPKVDDLHTKLTYSVSDVIALAGGYYTLVAPLQDIDASGRVFLISWRAKDGTAALRSAGDYYPAVSCVLSPAAPAESR